MYLLPHIPLLLAFLAASFILAVMPGPGVFYIVTCSAKCGRLISAYTFRHKVATVLRKARLSEDEIGLQLGHRREAARTTAGYGKRDPSYLT